MQPDSSRLPGRGRPIALPLADPAAPRLYPPFLAASLAIALTFGTTLGAINIARLAGTWGFLWRPSVWAHGYAQYFGFFALFIMGFACQALPRFVEGVPPRAWIATTALWCQVVGVLAVAGGFVFVPESAARLPWVAGSGALVLAAIAFLAIVSASLRTRTRPPASFERWVAAGAIWLVIGALLALAAALQDEIGWHHVLWPAMLYGFVGSWILGTGRRLFPISLGWQPRWPPIEAPSFVLYQAGVAAWSAGAWPHASRGSLGLRAAGAILLLVAMPAVAAGMGLGGPRLPWARKGVNPDLARHVRAAWAWLWVGLAAGPLATLFAVSRGEYGSGQLLDFSRHTIAVGFATQLLIGIGSRFVPAFTGRVLWSVRAHRAGFWLLNLGVSLRALEAVLAFGLLPAAWPLLSLSGPPVVLAILLFALNLAGALRAPPLGPFRRTGTVGAAAAALRSPV